MKSSPSESFPSKGGKSFPLFIGAILLFTGGMVVGLHLGQTEENYRTSGKSNEIALKNTSPQNLPDPVAKDSSIESSPSFYPKNLNYPPKMDQINYIIEIGAFEPGESSRVGKVILKEFPEFKGKLFRNSAGKLFSGYYYKQEDAKQALQQLRAFEKDDFTDAELKTIRF
jgi:hypothetical protein